MVQTYEEQLISYIQTEYGIAARSLSPAKRGFFGETWQLITDSSCYFVKIIYWAHQKEKYRNSFSTIDFLLEQGINFILKPVPTICGTLYGEFQGGVVGVFAYVTGDNREDYPLERLFSRLGKIYQLTPPEGIVPKEQLDAAVLKSYDALKKQVRALTVDFDEICAENETLISRCRERLLKFTALCQNEPVTLVVTHGDAGGNCILEGESFTIIDWDDPKLAPPERDAWFFMQQWWQIDVINKSILDAGFPYSMNSRLLCYYCYNSFFQYMCEYFQAYLGSGSVEQRSGFIKDFRNYFSSWVIFPISVADTIDA